MKTDFAANNKKLIIRLLLATTLMFGFSFALVPLYEVFCDLTGLNGKMSLTPAVDNSLVNSSETLLATKDTTPTKEGSPVHVQFIAVNNHSVSWDFKPNLINTVMYRGDIINTSYYARNTTARPMTVQAVPSVAPGKASPYIKKFECFCFERQTLESQTETDMALRFVLSEDLPEDIGQITLSYTLFDVSTFVAN